MNKNEPWYVREPIYVHSFLDSAHAKVARISPKFVRLPFLESGKYFGMAGAFWAGGARSDFYA